MKTTPSPEMTLAGAGRAGTVRLQTVLAAVLAAAILVGLPLAVSNPYYIHLAVLLLMWVALGQSWNLLGGYAGQVSFGHSAFFGVGAYTSSLLFTKAGAPLWLGIAAGGMLSVVMAVPIGWTCFRLRGPYFSLTILGFSEILRLIVTNWRDFTNGPLGVLFPPIFPSKTPFYYSMLGMTVLTMLACYLVVKSKLGFYFRAIREDQDAAEALGIDTTGFKLVALLISALFTGLVGGLYAAYVAYIDPPGVFSIPDVAIAMVVVALLGGLATFWGPAIGAVVVVGLSEVLRTTLGHVHLLVYAAVIMLVVLFMPEGIVGTVSRLVQRRQIRRQVSAFGSAGRGG